MSMQDGKTRRTNPTAIASNVANSTIEPGRSAPGAHFFAKRTHFCPNALASHE